MVVHHARKGGGDGGDSTLGSTAIFGSVDTAIILKRTEGKRTIETQQRYGTDMEASVLLYDEETKSVTIGGTKEEADSQRISREILEFLQSKDTPVDEPTIDDAVDGRTGLKRKTLRDLVAKHEITRTGGGRKGDPFLYSCLLVPSIYAEQEKQAAEVPEMPDNTDVFACSPNYVPQDENFDLF
jgi:hypothetical protein